MIGVTEVIQCATTITYQRGLFYGKDICYLLGIYRKCLGSGHPHHLKKGSAADGQTAEGSEDVIITDERGKWTARNENDGCGTVTLIRKAFNYSINSRINNLEINQHNRSALRK